ncbi:MAG TPA: hypothetical protein VFF72_06190 [Caldimonas sp.]|nr:hypothetical protein [Caldimonas sp.]
MTTMTIAALQWSRLRDLGDVAPLEEADLVCMAEIRAVLTRHHRLGRFALHLVHKHFDVADDEVLVEYSDATMREQHLRVERRSDVRDAIPTTWTLESEQPAVACVCAWRLELGHLGRHAARRLQRADARPETRSGRRR